MAEIIKGLLLIGLGCMEGYTFARVGLLPPQAMDDQMVFRSFIILKLFLSAVGASMFFQGLMSIATPQQFQKSRFYGEKAVGYVRSVGGCLILGVGMELCGSGPTLLASQIGVGINSAITIFGGMVVGGLVFGIAEPFVFDVETCTIPKKGQKVTVEQLLGGKYHQWAIPGGIFILIIVAICEIFLPHTAAIEKVGVPFSNPILPIFAGIVIGANQIPLRYITGDGQGGSTSIMNMIATVSCGLISKRHQIRDFVGSAQILYVYVGTLVGAYAGSDLNDIDGFNFARSFVGGILMMLGARIANGCTCGHGISGMSELGLQSIVATCAIFGGGIITGLIINYAI